MIYCEQCSENYGIKADVAESLDSAVCEFCAYQKPCLSAWHYMPDILARVSGNIPHTGKVNKFKLAWNLFFNLLKSSKKTQKKVKRQLEQQELMNG